ncbi:hypothetical protein DVH24_023038 [Malus domestica]|uniref:Folylpolyglutamate synthase n=1 Tax=Malus domestica TaxID=3750 RepID=A0A498KQZ8_MALDO|nr:hypothetical protein DVH24_023038 [Malus domestica]
MSTASIFRLLLLHFSLSTVLAAHSQPLTSPYLSPNTIHPNYQNMFNSFKIFIYNSNSTFPFTSPSQSLFYTRLQDSHFPTENPEKAHLFFVPFPSDLPPRSVSRLIRSLRTELPYWNRTLGADHFYLSCTGIGYESDRNLVELKKNSVQISCFPTPAGKFIPHKDISLPPVPSTPAPKTNTTSFLGYAKFDWVKESTLVKELSSDPDFLIESKPSDLNTFADRLGRSKFCLFEYGGGDVSGIGEALCFGCVPVVITDRPIHDLPFSDVLRWQEIALFVGRRGGVVTDLKRVLGRACWERHEKMRQLGVAASRHFMWNETPEPFDSFYTLMYQLWLRRHTVRYVRRESPRADKSNRGDRFDLLFDYLKILELEEPIAQMKIIHVAGTKGKGSTCTFTESILRHCGFRTGLFTSPHLIDVRERFRLDGVDINEEKFLAYFWWCFERLEEKATDDIPMPTYFRFLALLAFKIFAAEQVDVAILEVGLGGRFDATNVVQAPVVCGISSLGYDHMEILGNTLGAIAGEKAGIFKSRVPAFTVPQPDEAMRVLEEKASRLDVPLQLVRPLDPNMLNGLKLGLEGEHQYVNAGLAIALSSTWLQRTGHLEYPEHSTSLPEQYIKGLTAKVSLQGRAQIVPDRFINSESPEDLVFYLDGAHSPESMEICARWFSHSVQPPGTSRSSHDWVQRHPIETVRKNSEQILLFNCMSVRDPQLLLPNLMKTCASHGVYFKKALFVPNTSVNHKVGSHSLPPTDSQVDLSWQFALQKVWENLMMGNKGGDDNSAGTVREELTDDKEIAIKSCENSAVFPSLPSAIQWLRDSVRQSKSVRFQVMPVFRRLVYFVFHFHGTKVYISGPCNWFVTSCWRCVEIHQEMRRTTKLKPPICKSVELHDFLYSLGKSHERF